MKRGSGWSRRWFAVPGRRPSGQGNGFPWRKAPEGFWRLFQSAVPRRCPSLCAAKNVVVDQLLNYVDHNRKQILRQYKTFNAFKDGYSVPDAFISSLITAAKAKGLEPKDSAELQTTIPALKTQLKALIARDLWSLNEYFEIWNDENDVLQRTLKLIDNGR